MPNYEKEAHAAAQDGRELALRLAAMMGSRYEAIVVIQALGVLFASVLVTSESFISIEEHEMGKLLTEEEKLDSIVGIIKNWAAIFREERDKNAAADPNPKQRTM